MLKWRLNIGLFNIVTSILIFSTCKVILSRASAFENKIDILFQYELLRGWAEAVMCETTFACSAAVQQCLMTSSVWEAIRAIDSMAALDAGLIQSGCSHLRHFLQETLNFWHKILKDRLTRYISTYFVLKCGMFQKCKYALCLTVLLSYVNYMS